MNFWKTKISSICLIPEVTCHRNCPNCYEKKQLYGIPMQESEYTNIILQNMETLPSLTEMLIDYNGLESKELIITLLNINPKLKKTITTNVEGALKIADIITSNIELHLSIHNNDDILKVKDLKLPISSYSVMINDIDKLFLDQLGDVPFYFIYDKFHSSWSVWKAKNFVVQYFETIQKVQKFKQYTIDHCMLTRINGQECPASTQINIYRDGSVRRCPYQPKESVMHSFKGCNLIGADR